MVKKVCLFLGAGASKAFGYPTTKDFLANLKPKLDTTQNNIVETLKESKNVVDIEHILNIINAFNKLNSNKLAEEFLQRRPPKFSLIKGPVKWRNFITAGTRLEKLVISDLFNQYRFEDSKTPDIISLYNQLFEDVIFKFNRTNELDIFTTNYDSVIEELCESNKKNKTCTLDGFVPVGSRGRLFWRPKESYFGEFDKDAKIRLRLFKLHGSLNWCERKNGDIEKVVLEQKVEASSRYKNNMLIYPAQKTYAETEPYSTLHQYFRENLNGSMACIVIGFAFRDELINDIFLNFLRTHKRHRLIVLSPTATEDVKANLSVSARNKIELDRFETQVRRIDTPFEADSFDRLYKETLSYKRRITRRGDIIHQH